MIRLSSANPPLTLPSQVIATVNVLQPTSVFMIHIKNLTVTSTALSGGNKVDETFHYEPNQFWVIRTKAPVPKGSLDITLEFKGRLTLGIVGFYKSTYKGKGEGEREL